MQIKRTNINLIESIANRKSDILKSFKKSGCVNLAVWGNQIRVLQSGESAKPYEKTISYSAEDLLFSAFLNKIIVHDFEPEPEPAL